jgi:hypothetical protein
MEENEDIAQQEAALQLALKNVMRTDEGLRVLVWLLGKTEALKNNFNIDHSIMSYTCGRQSVGQELLEAMRQTDVKTFAKIMETLDD